MFSIYFAMGLPGIRMRGVDVNARRIEYARQAVRRLAIPDVEFETADACRWRPPSMIEAATMIDVIHHLPHETVEGLVGTVAQSLRPGCRLIIKDIDPTPWHKMAYTWMLDRIVDRRSPLCYWEPSELHALLEQFGLQVFQHRMSDFLPCPHVLYVAVKACGTGAHQAASTDNLPTNARSTPPV
jgi:2-polyprenyl-3-methyl-5-hydroxy-6-metoxy-1,4-benzoquinol methylase